MEYDIHQIVVRILSSAVGHDYAMEFADNDEFIAAVTEDIHTSSAWRTEHWFNDDDVRFAIGRVLLSHLGMM